MSSPRRARQGEPFKDAFARILEKEEQEFDQGDALHWGDGSLPLSSSTVETSRASVQEPISDLYRQHSHQQSMEGG